MTTPIPNTQPIALIVGGTQGIGLALVTNLLEGKTASTIFPSTGLVIATARDPKSPKLIELQKKYPDRLFIEVVDVTDEVSIDTFLETINSKYPRLDLYIHNSGVSLDDHTSKQPSKLDKETYFKTHLVNVIGPSQIFYGLANLLNQTHLQLSQAPTSSLNQRPRPLPGQPLKDSTTHVRALFISSIMGSMNLHTFFSIPIYRTSKASLNHIVKDMALTHRHMFIGVMHPGYVVTTLTKGTGQITADESAEGILTELVEKGFSVNSAQSIMCYNGHEIPW